MAYTSIIFDWDGTIANTREIWISSYKRLLLEEYHLDISFQDIVSKAYGNSSGVVSFGITDFRLFNRRLFEIVKENYYTSPLFPDSRDVLYALHEDKGLLLFLVSSTERRMLEKALRYYDLLGIFTRIIAREDVLEQKPSPEGIKIIVDSYTDGLDKTVIVGDSDKDVIAGKNARIDTILFLNEENTKYYHYETKHLLSLQPTYVIRSHKELLTIVYN